MSFSREGRSVSPRHSDSPGRGRRSRSLSRSRRSRSRSRDSEDAVNPGNNLYVTGLSTRVSTSDLEKYFGKEGKVKECHLVADPRTKESRGFAFVTMETTEDANRCIKYLNRSVLEGRLITVEKDMSSASTSQTLRFKFSYLSEGCMPFFPFIAKRKRGRTPTPGRYRGLRERQGRGLRRSRSYSPRRLHDREPYSRERRGKSRSPNYSRRTDEYHESYRRRRERSLSAGGSGYRR